MQLFQNSGFHEVTQVTKKPQTHRVHKSIFSRSVHFPGSGKVSKCGPWLSCITHCRFYSCLVCSGLWSQEWGNFTCYGELQFLVMCPFFCDFTSSGKVYQILKKLASEPNPTFVSYLGELLWKVLFWNQYVHFICDQLSENPAHRAFYENWDKTGNRYTNV